MEIGWRLATVLAGLAFPARTWQLVVQADYYGADSITRAELGRLPAGEYPNLPAVLWRVPDFIDTDLGCQFGEFSES
jgi:hypothetical protein